MRRVCQFVLIVAGLFAPTLSNAQATTYAYSGLPYTNFQDFNPPCGTGPCKNYPRNARLTGYFTTSSPLPSSPVNMGWVQILPLVTGFSFSDGLNTFSSTDADVRAFNFSVYVDGNGAIQYYGIVFQRWQSGANPHGQWNRVAILQLIFPSDASFNNVNCVSTSISQYTSVSDVCSDPYNDYYSTSLGYVNLPGTWTRVVDPPAPPLLQGAATRKTHGGAGSFDVQILPGP